MKKPQSGFSLIEVLIAAAVIGIAAIFLIRFQANVTRGTAIAAERNQAVKIAKTALDRAREIMLQPSTTGRCATSGICPPEDEAVEALLLGATLFDAASQRFRDANDSTTLAVGSASYTLRVDTDLDTTTDITAIQSTVSWSDAAGQTQNVILRSSVRESSTLLSSPGTGSSSSSPTPVPTATPTGGDTPAP